MPEPQSATDLRILDEMAEEIEKYGTTQLPGSLRKYVQTRRGKRVALALEILVSRVRSAEATLEQKTTEINGLRNDMQALSDSILEERK